MGSSKIVFVGAIAVIIGLFGFGLKKAEKQSAEMAAKHAYQINAKNLAEQGLQYAVKRLPRWINSVNPKSSDRSTKSGTYGFAYEVSDLATGRVKVVSYGIANGQQATVTTILENTPPGPKPPTGVKAWNGWKLVSSIRSYTTIED